MRTVFILALSLFTSLQVLATAQIPDKIMYNGKEYALHSNPLEVYFEKHPDKRPKNGMMSTALWRGYVATFEIKENQLLLKDIEIEARDSVNKNKSKWISVRNEVFPDEKIIKIDWITGLLVLPYGKVTNYVHMGYASTYENYILLEMNEGNLLREKKFTGEQYEKFKEKQFEAFKKTDNYKKLKEELQKEGESEEFFETFLRIYVIDYSSKILVDE